MRAATRGTRHLGQHPGHEGGHLSAVYHGLGGEGERRCAGGDAELVEAADRFVCVRSGRHVDERMRSTARFAGECGSETDEECGHLSACGAFLGREACRSGAGRDPELVDAGRVALG